MSSRCSRGEVAPVISVRARFAMSAARESPVAPNTPPAGLMVSSSSGTHREHGRGALVRRSDHDEVAEAFEQVLHEAPRVLPGLHHAVDRGERRCRVGHGERVDDVVEQRGVGVPEQRDGSLVGDRAVLAPRDELVEQGQSVADGTAAGADDERQHARGDRDGLLLAQLLDVLEHRRRRHEPERVVVGARPDGADDLLGLGVAKMNLTCSGGSSTS